jgi:hypothetical protein
MPIPSPLGTQKALITSPIPLIIPNISCGIGQRPEFPLQSDEKREVAPAFGCLPSDRFESLDRRGGFYVQSQRAQSTADSSQSRRWHDRHPHGVVRLNVSLGIAF